MTKEERSGLGARIKVIREERGLSLSDLARSCEVTKGYLSQLEHGKATNPSVEAVKKIAQGLGVSLSDLLEEPTAPPPDASLPEGLRSFLAQSRDEGNPLSEADVEMLLGIRYRGRPPRTADDYAFLYDVIKRTIR